MVEQPPCICSAGIVGFENRGIVDDASRCRASKREALIQQVRSRVRLRKIHSDQQAIASQIADGRLSGQGLGFGSAVMAQHVPPRLRKGKTNLSAKPERTAGDEYPIWLAHAVAFAGGGGHITASCDSMMPRTKNPRSWVK